jgi:dinuclear metal center YbgI/SA1388 family protein
MTPKLKDLLDVLEQIAPSRLAEPWDNPGLQVGSYSQEIKKIFFALDPTLRALRSAFKAGAQLLLTHHPLIFKPLSRLEIQAYPQNVIFEAVRNKISIVAAHTNLDVAKGGMNDILADMMELQEVEVLRKTNEDNDGVGLGRIGDLNEPTNLLGVVSNVKRILGAEKVRLVGEEDAMVRRLAVVAGSGGSLVPLAFQKGADLLLTGDVSHHHALEAEALGIALIDSGHFHTEKATFSNFTCRLEEKILAKGWEVTVEVDDNETNPMCDG